MNIQNVLIADDHEVTRRGVREILLDQFPQLKIGEAGDFRSVHAHLNGHPCDLVLLDILMPGEPIVPTIQKIRKDYPRLLILVLTAVREIEYVVQCMQAGAHGLVYKHKASSDLLEAVEKVSQGGTYLDVESAVAVATALRGNWSKPHQKLSERELEVFRLLSVGRSVKEIAAQTGLSDKTVATYLARIREKTGLTSLVEIARYALQNKLVD